MSLAHPHPSPFSLDVHDRRLSIVVQHEIFDASVVEEFRQRVRETWSQRIDEIEIDLEHVRFVDSSGIGALLGLQKRLRDEGKPITLLNPGPAVRSVIELLRLQRVFSIQQSPLKRA